MKLWQRRQRWWAITPIMILAAALLVPLALVRAEPPATVYFPQTGHHVGAPFLSYWRTHGALPVFGYPLTEAFTEVSVDDNKPYTVQYFERARLEAHPENAPPYDVLLGHLGRRMAERIKGHPAFPPLSPDRGRADAARSFFPETGHTLGGAFREYWLANGGLAQFGYPISEEFAERSPTDGKVYTVQYFERNRFELHPENQPPYNVLLGHLGRQIAQERGISFAPTQRLEGVPDFDESLFFTPTPTPTATPTPPPPTATPVPPPPPPAGGPRPGLGRQYIEVNLSEQHLYAWEGGEIVFDIAISSGMAGWETPTGTFYVLSKLASDDMTGGTAGSDDYY